MLRKILRLLDRLDRTKDGEIIDVYRIRISDRERWDEVAERLIAERDAELRARPQESK